MTIRRDLVPPSPPAAFDLLPWSAISTATVEVASATHQLEAPTVPGASYRLVMSTNDPWSLSLDGFDLTPYLTADGRLSMVMVPAVPPLATSDTSCFVGVWDGSETTVPAVGPSWAEPYSGSRSGEVLASTMTPTTAAVTSFDRYYFDTVAPSVVCDHHWGPTGGARRADGRMSEPVESVAPQIVVAASRVISESGGTLGGYVASETSGTRTAAGAPRLVLRINGSAVSTDSPEIGIWLLNVQRLGLATYSP